MLLLSPSGTRNPYLAEFGWVAGRSGNGESAWARQRVEGFGRTFDAVAPGDIDLGQRPRLDFYADYFRRSELHVHRASRRCTIPAMHPVKLLPYGLISRTGTPPVAGYYILFEGIIGYLDGSLHEVKYSALSSG